jgi:hypothetical protein
VYVVTALNGSTLDANGANAEWDISGISYTMVASGTQFVAPSATPYAASYPTSDLARWVAMPNGLKYSYLLADAQGLYLLADGVDASGGSVYVNGKTVLQFPFVYNTSFTDSYTLNGSEETQTRTYSAYGTLTTHLGTFTNVVKVSSGSGVVDFYTSGSIEPLFHYEPNGTSMLFAPTMVGIEEGNMQPALTAYPNPTTGHMTLTGLSAGAKWCLLDPQGRQVLQGTSNNSRVDLGDIAPGKYVLQAVEKGRVRTVLVVKQ